MPSCSGHNTYQWATGHPLTLFCRCQALVNQTITGVPSIETVRLLDDISDTVSTNLFF